MPPIFSDTRLIAAACLVGALVLGINFTLFNLLRGRRPNGNEAATWTRAIGAGRKAQRQQGADIDELHRAVAALKPKSNEPEPPYE